ncbi:MAG: hypothetical protein M1828_003372 [Chrysothrix sp. TS-e1954]|nr:MAG: hypothetical protein M1828_003372 [Chrysothrix sp. TS-e1954]
MGDPKTCFATVSLDNLPDNQKAPTLQEKLQAIASAGFKGIELAFPNLVAFASSHHERDIAPDAYDDLCSAGTAVKDLTAQANLKIMMLQPFSNFEGWPRGSKEREQVFERAKGWIRVMEAAGTDTLQVGATDTPDITTDENELAKDLGELADLLAKKGFRLAYENWCWATKGSGWEDVWRLVDKVNKPNIGLCLDTFQTAGGEWADPTTASGKIETVSARELEDTYTASMRKLAKVVPSDKIYVLQISDAYRMSPPLKDNVDESGTRPRGRWSHDYRPLPYDGGYLPVVAMTKAVLDTGFGDWLSIEVFDGGADGKGKLKEPSAYTTKAMGSLMRLITEASEVR